SFESDSAAAAFRGPPGAPEGRMDSKANVRSPRAAAAAAATSHRRRWIRARGAGRTEGPPGRSRGARGGRPTRRRGSVRPGRGRDASGIPSEDRARSWFLPFDRDVSVETHAARYQQLPEPSPGPGQARSNGSDGDVQGVGDLRVAEVGPGEQEKDVAFARAQVRQGWGQRGAHRPGIGPGLRGLEAGIEGAERIGSRARVREELASLGPPVMPEEIGGDPQ